MTTASKTTRVLFPRFETECPTDGDTVRRDLTKIAKPRKWMVESEFDRLLHPNTDINAGFFDNKARQENWWGVWHRAKVVMPLGMLATEEPESVPFASDPMSLYRYQHISHSYLWDSQAVSGIRDEVVLERLTLSGFRGVLALLSDPQDRSEQMLVRADEDGEWYEPDFVNISRDPERKFYLDMMSSIARQTWDDFGNDVDALTSGSL